jgi:hypothetical protein
VLRRRLVRAGRHDQTGVADAVGLQLLYDNPIEERSQLLAHGPGEYEAAGARVLSGP